MNPAYVIVMPVGRDDLNHVSFGINAQLHQVLKGWMTSGVGPVNARVHNGPLPLPQVQENALAISWTE
jgi:hypothetical protein